MITTTHNLLTPAFLPLTVGGFALSRVFVTQAVIGSLKPGIRPAFGGVYR